MTSDTPAGRRLRVFSRRRGAPSKARRRLGAATRMVAALALAGGVYTAFAPGAFADEPRQLSATAQEGKQLYDNSCISCHGRDGQGVDDRGPSLIGVGSASVEFQVGTGRMPMTRQEAQAEAKKPQFDKNQTKQLGQYIQELGGGPQLPSGELVESLEDNPEAIARGGELFRVNCTSCHSFGGAGGALSSGKFAPALHDATPETIYAAMLTGPQNMPVFGDNQLTPEEKREIITYITLQLQEDKDPGGLFNLGRYGPSTEGIAIFLVGITLLVFTSLWIAGKS
ncbi:cytochrome bc1 complex diheme cytochrome c subunit [Paractinoplanes brasiliensis]|uniref:Cytochrome bc1 complex cytochrome c subunit n=1 Tax=Paractinoplanes brasiliensis TaxID=52695 RepID=A0A4V3C7I3_9ACTN|nr:cytochrome c [Actinoplanes brasiliensis]TDO37788.1 menaquinol-cytochrome c reductase cytochrome c1 subunit precursor [Actinoplanes brasiliensis]GID32129.1 putative ubiquinol-cytochrome c reductase cytochrome c subunit [Actinoplanes brasiliensis]